MKSIKLNTLKLNPKNPRLIKDMQFKKLCESIKDFPKMMELRPLIVDDKNIILGGNMRLKALQELKYKQIPASWVKKASELTAKEKKEFIIKDNLQAGEWDLEILANQFEIDQLVDFGFDKLDLGLFDIKNKEKEISELETENECPSCGYKW